MAKQKWAVKKDFEDMINFLSDIGVEDIKLHIENTLQKRTTCHRCTGSRRICLFLQTKVWTKETVHRWLYLFIL